MPLSYLTGLRCGAVERSASGTTELWFIALKCLDNRLIQYNSYINVNLLSSGGLKRFVFIVLIGFVCSLNIIFYFYNRPWTPHTEAKTMWLLHQGLITIFLCMSGRLSGYNLHFLCFGSIQQSAACEKVASAEHSWFTMTLCAKKDFCFRLHWASKC